MRTHLGQYRIDETLGRGGMGIVYRGVHERLGRQVAIKALAPELTQQPEFKDRFFAEAKTQARLLHPNVVGVYDLVEEDGEFFIVMEFVDGMGLDDRFDVASNGPVDVETTAALMVQVLSALDYAHSEGVIHRDIKPSNVMISSDGRVKLTDFGIALLIGDKRLTSSQSAIGTPTYMSPEQIVTPRSVDHRTDIYSAAVVFYELLAGRPPFDDETEYGIKKQHVENPPPDLQEIAPSLPSALVSAIATALEKDPNQRFASAGQFLRAIREAVPGAEEGAAQLAVPAPQMAPVPSLSAPAPGPEVASPSSPPSTTDRPEPRTGGSWNLAELVRTRWAVGAISALGLLVVAILVVVLLGSSGDGDGAEEVAVAEAADPERGDGLVPEPAEERRTVYGSGEPVALVRSEREERPGPSTQRSESAEESTPVRASSPPAPPPPRSRSAPQPQPRPQPQPDPVPVSEPDEPVVPEPVEEEVAPEVEAAPAAEFDFTRMKDLLDDVVRLSEEAADAADDEDLEVLEDRIDNFHDSASDTRKAFRRATGTGLMSRFRPEQGTDDAAYREFEIGLEHLIQDAAGVAEVVRIRGAGSRTGDLWSVVHERVRSLSTLPTRP